MYKFLQFRCHSSYVMVHQLQLRCDAVPFAITNEIIFNQHAIKENNIAIFTYYYNIQKKSVCCPVLISVVNL